MSAPQLTIFITGATGYIGGMILTRLLSHRKRDTFNITAIVRDADKARKLHDEFGVNAVVGSTDDSEKLATLASEADVVFSTTSATDLSAAKAILAGAKTRYERTGVAPILIHTSGTSTFADDARGTRSSDVVYDDLNIAQIESLPDTAHRRNVDLVIVAADKEGYVRTYIVLPPLVWGTATGPLFASGISKPHTIVLKWLIDIARQCGRVLQFGDGLNRMGGNDIHEMGDAYIKLFDIVVEEPEKAAHGREGYYFTDTHEFEVRQYTQALGKYLVKSGVISDPEPRASSEDEIAQYWGGSTVMGANIRSTAKRLGRLGWAPVKTTEDMLTALEDDVRDVLRSTSA